MIAAKYMDLNVEILNTVELLYSLNLGTNCPDGLISGVKSIGCYLGHIQVSLIPHFRGLG